LFGCDLSGETKVAAADSIVLQLKDLVDIPTEVDLGKFKQSLSCKNQSKPCGNENEGLFAFPDPDFAPVIVLFGEDDDNKTAVVVLGDEQDVKDTNDAGIIAQIIDSFSSITPEEELKEGLMGDIPQYGRESREFNHNDKESDDFEYPHPIKGVHQTEEDKNIEENDRSYLRNSRVLVNPDQSKNSSRNTDITESTSDINEEERITGEDGLVKSFVEDDDKQTPTQENITETTDATKNIFLMPPFGAEYDYDQVLDIDMERQAQQDEKLYNATSDKATKKVSISSTEKTNEYENSAGKDIEAATL
jgi:hypothetical protein